MILYIPTSTLVNLKNSFLSYIFLFIPTNLPLKIQYTQVCEACIWKRIEYKDLYTKIIQKNNINLYIAWYLNLLGRSLGELQVKSPNNLPNTPSFSFVDSFLRGMHHLHDETQIEWGHAHTYKSKNPIRRSCWLGFIALVLIDKVKIFKFLNHSSTSCSSELGELLFESKNPPSHVVARANVGKLESPLTPWIFSNEPAFEISSTIGVKLSILWCRCNEFNFGGCVL